MGMTACREPVVRLSTHKTRPRLRRETVTRPDEDRNETRKDLRLPNFVRTLPLIFFPTISVSAVVQAEVAGIWRAGTNRSVQRFVGGDGRTAVLCTLPSTPRLQGRRVA